MSIFSKIRNVFKHVPKKAAVVSGILAAVMIPVTLFAWGPDRATFTIEKPADYVAFNSITNNPNIGDERNFVGARDASTGNNGKDNVWNANQITVEKGKEYYVRMYVHNNANSNLGLVAKDVTAKFNVPTTTGTSVTVSGILSSSNAKPNEYWDSVEFVSDTDFNLVYVAGSARYENNAIGAGGTGGVQLADSIVTNSGVLLGYDKLDGKIPGCFQYAGYVTFKVTPQFAETFDFGASKQVSKHDAKEWGETYEAQPGELVDFRIDYTNVSGERQDNVTLRDFLPEGLTVESVRWYNLNAKEWQTPVNDITTTGINIGSYINAGTKTRAELTVRMPEEDALECGVNTFKNIGSVYVNGYRRDDDATVTIDKECQEPSVAICKVLNANPLAIKTGDAVSFEVIPEYSGNVEVVGSYIDYGDGFVTTPTNVLNYTYAYNKAGTFTAKARINFIVDGEELSDVSSVDCEKTIEVEKVQEFCEVPGKEHLPKDDPDCKEDEKEEFCEVPGKEHLPKDDPNCKSDEVPKNEEEPTEIPKTGMEAFGVLGLGSLTTAVAYYISSRRKL